MPVCSNPASVNAAYDLLVALCTGCVPNLKSLAAMLIDMYYNGENLMSFCKSQAPDMKTLKFVNSIDPDEAACSL